jgi:hypothetical protein
MPPKTPTAPPLHTETTARKHLIGRIVAGLVVASALLGIFPIFDWARDQYDKTTPDVSVRTRNGSRRPPAFLIKNSSPYFWMTSVQLICGIDSAMFETDSGGPIGFSFPVTSGISNPPIKPTKTVEFPCDPTNYMKIENGRISLMGLTTERPIPNLTSARLIDATVWIGVLYRTMCHQPANFPIGKMEAYNRRQ